MKFDLKKATKHFEASKLTKTQLSEKLHLHQSSVGDWFLGRNDPSKKHIVELARVLKVKVEDITVDESKRQVKGTKFYNKETRTFNLEFIDYEFKN